MAKLQDLIGTESDLAEVGSALREAVSDLGPAAVGAYHVTCSDEVECECVEAFQRGFVAELLPTLKPGTRTPFRSVNLGARYERGAIHIAEEHYATPAAQDGFKLMAVKINAHVAVQESSDGPAYGLMNRYGGPSTCCGALASMLAGGDLPAVKELAQTFRTDGNDRVKTLNDSMPAKHRALLASVTNARLQAGRAASEISQYQPQTPTHWLILCCVSINRPEPDTELIVGRYLIDTTGEAAKIEYQGLGDNPATYRVEHHKNGLRIADDHWPAD